MRWTWFRAWFPVIWFIAYWINSYLNYHFGFIIQPSLHTNTQIYLICSMILFIAGYAIGLGPYFHYVRFVSPEAVLHLNWKFFSWSKVYVGFSLVGAIGLILGIYASGAAGISETLNNLETLREDVVHNLTPITTISMFFWSFSLLGMATIFVYGSIYTNQLRLKYYIIFGLCCCLLCFQSFLSANRGNFVLVFGLCLFDIFYVKGTSPFDLFFGIRWFWIRNIAMVFMAIAALYFVFIGRNRGVGVDSFLDISSQINKQVDRYNIYEWYPGEDKDCTAFLSAYGYCCTGYDAIDAFVQNAEPFAFRPLPLIGDRVYRQINRFLPKEAQVRTDVGKIGNEWRMKSGVSLFGWPTCWGWSLVMFGYIGAPIFFLILGWFLGFSSGEFIRFGSIGAMLVCFGNFCVLINSFNGWGGDIPYQVAAWCGFFMMMKSRSKRMWYYKQGLIR